MQVVRKFVEARLTQIDRKKESETIISEVENVLSTVVHLSDTVDKIWHATQCWLLRATTSDEFLT
jgi:hypothetical protein